MTAPPSGPNWVRFVHDEPEPTAKAILQFAKGIPKFTYRTGYVAAKDRIELGIGREAAIKIALTRGAPAGRNQNREFVDSFFDHDDVRQYSCSNPIEFDRGFFRVSRDIVVPVAPLSVIRESGKFLPIFVCGWNSIPLSLMQRRLLVTICDDAFLSLTDFQDSDAEFLFFPKKIVAGENAPKRVPEVWQRSDYNLLTTNELDRCVEIYLTARESARVALMEQFEAEKESAKRDSDSEITSPLFMDDSDLFGKK